MDEAERCHKLSFISGGRLLVNGSVDEVVARAGLTTWSVSGPNLAALSRRLLELPGVDQAVAFGNTLHVSGQNEGLLDRSIAPFRTGLYEWLKIKSGLEDVFIQLMEKPVEGPQ
jgi:ABC-2 type transport system ATP-binding protein